MMPQMTSEEEGPLAEFSTARAFTQVQNIANPIMWAPKTIKWRTTCKMNCKKLGLETLFKRDIPD
jgi:hypothetical protein